ncbi:CHASE2 domain-containing protein [Aquincola sp. MAHUQ-54]|uniref:CHASE2 domain-containing protein n=1 Tax=Aquincola agrisoli TaxID=3119538 RepID=A0AAW9QFS5_9BURK
MPTRTFRRRLTRREASLLGLFGLGVAAVVALASHAGLAPVAAMDRAFLDALVRRTASGAPAQRTVVVDIDDVSLDAVGQWPWPRYRIASLLQRIAADRPAAIAIDILFPEPDRTSIETLRQAFQRDFGLSLDVRGVPAGLDDNDGYLGEVIGQAGAIGGSYLYFDHTSRGGTLATGLQVTGRTDLLSPPAATGLMANTPPIAAATATTGFVNSWPDADGQLRRLPLVLAHGGSLHVHMALAAALRAMGETQVRVEPGPHGARLVAGTHRIPVARDGTALLRFDGPPARYPVVPAIQVLQGEAAPAAFEGKVVILGTSAVGLNDLQPTAVHPRFPGAQVQAAMVDNILSDRHLVVPDWGRSAVATACVLAAIATTAVFMAGGSVALFVAGSAATAVLVAAPALAGFALRGLVVSPAAPLAVVAILFVACFVTRFAIERRRAAAWQRQLENARQVTIESMAAVAETRDPETGAHIKRTQHYVRAIAEELRRSGHYTATLTQAFIDLLFMSAPLHDIGKVGVPDHILLKPGRLTPDEMAQMKRHAEYGRHIISNTAERIDGENFLTIAGEIAETHHEKWDGTGYPHGLAGQEIPLSGRIMAVADIYDALISRRCYKEPFTHAHSTDLMRAMRGTTFDPLVLDAFFRIEEEIQRIARQYQDEEEEENAPPAHLAAARQLVGRLQAAEAAAPAPSPAKESALPP